MAPEQADLELFLEPEALTFDFDSDRIGADGRGWPWRLRPSTPVDSDHSIVKLFAPGAKTLVAVMMIEPRS